MSSPHRLRNFVFFAAQRHTDRAVQWGPQVKPKTGYDRRRQQGSIRADKGKQGITLPHQRHRERSLSFELHTHRQGRQKGLPGYSWPGDGRH